MAPVTRRVADRQQDRHVAPLGLGERFGAHRVPVDGIVAVLAQVRGGLVGEPRRCGDHTARDVSSVLYRL